MIDILTDKNPEEAKLNVHRPNKQFLKGTEWMKVKIEGVKKEKVDSSI